MAENGIQAQADWYDGFFEDDYLDHVALQFEAERTEREAGFVSEALGIEPGTRVLDLACGHGRIALELARRGFRVTGLDLSPRSLRIARDAAEREGLDVEWVHADMREIPAGAEFDAIYNVFTSFGYFTEEEENQRVLQGVARALRPRGSFLIDINNVLGLMPRYRDRFWDVAADGVIWLQEHEVDVLGGRNHARWTFIRPDGSRVELVHSVRMYTPYELATMLERAGLAVEQAWGDFDGSDLTRVSRRAILLGRKP